MRCYMPLSSAASNGVYGTLSPMSVLCIPSISSFTNSYGCCSSATTNITIPTNSSFTGGLFSYTIARFARVRGKTHHDAVPPLQYDNETVNKNNGGDDNMDNKETSSTLSLIRRHLGAIEMQESLEDSCTVKGTANISQSAAFFPETKDPLLQSNKSVDKSMSPSSSSSAINDSTDAIYSHNSKLNKKIMSWCIPDHLDRRKCFIADIYRREKINQGFAEVFRGTLNGADSSYGSLSTRLRPENCKDRPSKYRYMVLLPFLNPVRETPLGIAKEHANSNKGKQIKEVYDTNTSNISKGATVGALISKIRMLWEREKTSSIQESSTDNPLSAQTLLHRTINSETFNEDETDEDKYSITILQQETADLEALERVLLCLSQEELKLAIKCGLIDIGGLVSKKPLENNNGSDAVASDVPHEGQALPVGCSVLPRDILEAISQAHYCTEWLKDAAGSVTSGLPEDDVAPVLAKGVYASLHERNRLTKINAPSLYSTFTADELRILEDYEEHTTNSKGGVSASSQFAKSPILSGTNPVLRRLCTIDPQLQEVMLVMDRTRRDSLMDEKFQDALRYVNAQHSRSLNRYNNFVSMKGITREEKKNLTRRGILMSRTGTHRNLKRDNSSPFSNSNSDVSNSSDSSFLADKYDERSLAIAKGMRIMNPGAPSMHTHGGSVDIPYFLSGGSIPPPHASINIPLPTRNKIGRRAANIRHSKGINKTLFGR